MSDDGDSALRGVAAAMIGVGLASLGLLAYLFADVSPPQCALLCSGCDGEGERECVCVCDAR